MAKANPVQLDPQPPVVDAPVAAAGPEIVFVGEGAEKVQFTMNPLASKYVVYASGMIVETLR